MSSRDAYVESYLDKCAWNFDRVRRQEWTECLWLHILVNRYGVSVMGLARRLDEEGLGANRSQMILNSMARVGKYRQENPDAYDWEAMTWGEVLIKLEFGDES